MTRRKSITTITLCALFGLVIGGLFGCEQSELTYQVDERTYQVGGMTIQLFEFDGCQYLKTRVRDGYSITHKGNCNNPIHKSNNSY